MQYSLTSQIIHVLLFLKAPSEIPHRQEHGHVYVEDMVSILRINLDSIYNVYENHSYWKLIRKISRSRKLPPL